MQPYNGGGGGGNNRAEAERWLVIAEKLLGGRDLVGTKTFAIRARESDPRFDAADLILAVADTLLASEKQINNHPDWYSILQLPTLCGNLDLIANQYRRLALLLNPHKNRLPYADQALTMVSYAWSVLSDPAKKFIYDNEFNVFARFDPTLNRTNEINLQFVQNPIQQQHLQQQQPPPQFPPPQMHQLPPAQQQPQMHQLPLPQQQNYQFQSSQLQDQHLTPQFPHPQPQNPEPSPQQNVESVTPVNEQQQQPNRSPDDKDAPEESEMEGSGDENSDSTFWTACPYCYYMYEYPGVYKDCTFRCHNCKRAFHGLKIESPPAAAIEGKDAYFCCWGFIPLAGFMSTSNNKKKQQAWSPFSQMVPCTPAVKKAETKKAPVYYNNDKDDIFVDVSSSDDSSDGDWRMNSTRRKKKKVKYAKEKSQSKDENHREAEKGKKVDGDQPVAMEPQNVSLAAESSRKGASSNIPNKVQGKVPKEWGRLDLNVEFSNNEAEESGSGIRVGGGAGRAVHAEEEEEEDDAEEGIEGIGFFEGLDDFLSSLPILNVVGEDNKVKAV